MEAGIVTEEGLTTVLRQIGQKRRQGVLELVYPDRLLEFLFVQGKIVEVLCQGEDVSRAVFERLKEAGIVPSHILFEREDGAAQSQNYRTLFLSLVESGVAIDEDFFRNAIKQCVLDRTCDVDLTGNARFQFKAEMVEADREFSPTISIGQVLLDLVALPSNQERFEKLFPDPAQVAVMRTETPEGVLTAEEKLIYDELKGARSVESLQKRVVLSRFYFWDGVLSLFERGLISACAVSASDSVTRDEEKDSPPLRELIQSAVISGTEAESLIGAIADAAAECPKNATEDSALPPEGETEYEERQLSSAEQQTAPYRARSERWSLRMLESAAAVQVVAIVYVLACLTVPWFTWAHIMSYFAE